MEVFCDECNGSVTPEKEDISDPDFLQEEGYTYTEYYCPTCETILWVERRPKEAS